MPSLDFVERPAPGVAAVMCARCRTIKPEKDFERKLTPLQARARGYMGAFDVAYISSICHTCKPVRRKPISELTAVELRNMHTHGKIRTYEYKDELQRRKESRSKLGREAVMRRWASKHDSMWQPIMENLRNEAVAVVHQHKRAQTKGIDDGGFFDEYLRQLTLLRMELKHRRRIAIKPPLFTTWEAHFNDDTRRDLSLRWRNLMKDLVKTDHGDWVLRTREPLIVSVRYPEKPPEVPKKKAKVVPAGERTEHMINVDTSIYNKPLASLANAPKTEVEKDSDERLALIKGKDEIGNK